MKTERNENEMVLCKEVRETDECGNLTYFKDCSGFEVWMQYDEDGNCIYYKNSTGFCFTKAFIDTQCVRYQDTEGDCWYRIPGYTEKTSYALKTSINSDENKHNKPVPDGKMLISAEEFKEILMQSIFVQKLIVIDTLEKLLKSCAERVSFLVDYTLNSDCNIELNVVVVMSLECDISFPIVSYKKNIYEGEEALLYNISLPSGTFAFGEFTSEESQREDIKNIIGIFAKYFNKYMGR